MMSGAHISFDLRSLSRHFLEPGMAESICPGLLRATTAPHSLWQRSQVWQTVRVLKFNFRVDVSKHSEMLSHYCRRGSYIAVTPAGSAIEQARLGEQNRVQ